MVLLTSLVGLTGCDGYNNGTNLPPSDFGLSLTLSTNVVAVETDQPGGVRVSSSQFPDVIVLTNGVPIGTNGIPLGHTIRDLQGFEYVVTEDFQEGPNTIFKTGVTFSPDRDREFPPGDSRIGVRLKVVLANGPRVFLVDVGPTNFTLLVTSTFNATAPAEPTPPAGFTNLVSFGGPSPIQHAPRQLVQGSDGRLYGAAVALDALQTATNAVVKLDLDGRNPQVLASLGPQGGAPAHPVLGQGLLPVLSRTRIQVDGTNQWVLVGAAAGHGLGFTNTIIFRLNEDGTDAAVIGHLESGFSPKASQGFHLQSLGVDRFGRVLGTTREGGRPDAPAGQGGTIFAVWPDQPGLRRLTQFPVPDHLKHGGVIEGSDQRLYGVAGSEAVPDPFNFRPDPTHGGFLYTADYDGGAFRNLHTFPPPGEIPGFARNYYPVIPRGDPAEASDGFLYGAYGFLANNGDPVQWGTNLSYYYRIGKNGADFTMLARAPGSQTPAPTALVEGSDGRLYGFLAEGVNQLIALRPGTGELEVVADLGPAGQSGNSQHLHTTGALLSASDGALYGTVLVGGEHDRGYLFRYVPDNPPVPSPALPAAAGSVKAATGDAGAREETPQLAANPPASLPPLTALTLATNLPGRNAGRSVSVSGHWLVLGVPFGTNADYAGAAHVFTRTGSTWSHSATLTPPAGDPVRFFGFSAALSGDSLAIGAPGYFHTDLFAGAVYVFTNDQGGWRQTAKVTGANQPGDEFGDKVALDGSAMLVGAPGETNGGPQAGGAWFFERDGTGGWIMQRHFTEPERQANGHFGAAVALLGNYAVVGAPQGRELDVPQVRGRAHLYRRVPGVQPWTFRQSLESYHGYAGDFFGASVALTTNAAIVGLPGSLPVDPTDPLMERRGAIVFRLQNNSWFETSRLAPDQHRALEMFGASLATDGNRVTVGAPHDPEFRTGEPGSAYVFELAADFTATQKSRLQAHTGQANDGFGLSVSLSADTVAVGALLQDNGAAFLSGAVHLFDLAATAQPPVLTLVRNGAELRLTWDPGLEGFTLESSPAVGTDANWQPVTPMPTGASYLINVSQTMFFRLVKP